MKNNCDIYLDFNALLNYNKRDKFNRRQFESLLSINKTRLNKMYKNIYTLFIYLCLFVTEAIDFYKSIAFIIFKLRGSI